VPDGAWESMKRAATARAVASTAVAALPVQALVPSVAPVAAAPVAFVVPVAAAPLAPPPPEFFLGVLGNYFDFLMCFSFFYTVQRCHFPQEFVLGRYCDVVQ
jgi:hypothetical protein